METNSLIRIEQVCKHCQIDVSFIQSLHELGHITLIVNQDDFYISEAQLKSLESLIHFHTELHINLEGIDAIVHLLKKIEDLQNELALVKSKLDLSATSFRVDVE